jgi:malonyl-CoA O-methyltransferase
MPTETKYALNNSQIAKSFNKIASHYDQVAILQREVAHRLVERLDYIKLHPEIIVELGSATGYCTHLIQQRYPQAKIISIDLAFNMLRYASENPHTQINAICADAYHLPLQDNSVDLIISNMMLPWCDDHVSLFRECHRVLRPEKLLMFATLGPDTLKELRLSWVSADDYPHVNSFTDMHDIGDALVHAQFLDPVMDSENIQLLYPRVELILKDLKMMGSQNMNINKRRSLLSKIRFKQFLSAYEKYQLDDSQFPVSCEITYGHAWSANIHEGLAADNEGTVSIPLEHLRRLIRRPM